MVWQIFQRFHSCSDRISFHAAALLLSHTGLTPRVIHIHGLSHELPWRSTGVSFAIYTVLYILAGPTNGDLSFFCSQAQN